MALFNFRPKRIPPEQSGSLSEETLEEIFDDIGMEDGETFKGITQAEATESESESDSENSADSSSDASNSSSSQSGHSGGMATGISTAAAAAAAAVLVLGSVSNVSADFQSIEPHGKSLDYEVTVTMEYEAEEGEYPDWNDLDTGLVLMASNSRESTYKPLVTSDRNTQVSIQPKSDDEENTAYDVSLTFCGVLDGLKERHPYQVSVVGYDEDGSAKVYCSDEITTTGPVTEIQGIDGYCTCTTDGNYHFWLTYLDEADRYTSFTYRLLSPDGEEVMAGTITDPGAETLLENVDQLPGSEYILEITITSTADEDLEAVNDTSFSGDTTTVTRNQGVIVITQTVLF